ncbi:hypothetical protein [Cupriavidus taiwanensis]|uniref:hypothetical protein n=1 Tax=Cupriavidus taiwanensis TaxID=164546 RepID=UPI000E107B6E|nr:hypothetical protein [Cupriavidus taiwanensis]SOY56830.1 hypothetical protein CBM2592_A90125 [Cupriavidus taiwanensis]SOY90743.1 hypothetical protein CBM2591_A90123 [Cupriavidus taiwanensis]SOZ63537.1 hypothetical protein CBM2617_A70101 [Cupriavidus taiwanensis]SOZ82563.1 hypothetical protein CBM2618_A80102 [Cupriavidus taiwanensis]SOZ84422.1 hypothetical protein CBM2622_A80101 [Cupriavidus taiwanensis]
MTAAVLKDVSANKARPVKMLEVVDALMARAGEQFTVDDLLHRFGSTAKKLGNLVDKAANSALLRKGRNVAGHVVYWAPTVAEQELARLTAAYTGTMRGYEDYLHSHWRLAESVQWERR